MRLSLTIPKAPDGYRFATCEQCEGFGKDAGPYGGDMCKRCFGTGEDASVLIAIPPATATCPTCGGCGRVPAAP